MKKNIILISIICYVLGVVSTITFTTIYNNIKKVKLENKVIYSVIVTAEKINLRPEVDLKSDIIKEVYKDEKFKVIQYYEGNTYNWYKVIYEDNKTGWLASGKNSSWVEVVTNGNI